MSVRRKSAAPTTSMVERATWKDDDGTATAALAMAGCGFGAFLEGGTDFGASGGVGGDYAEEDGGEDRDAGSEGVDVPVEG